VTIYERTATGWWVASDIVNGYRIKAMADTKTGAKRLLAKKKKENSKRT
jgi:hypothetical protein